MFTFFIFQKSFVEADGIKKMTELLALRVDRESTEVNDKMTEVLLSILGNCSCNNLEAATQASFVQFLIELTSNGNVFAGI